MRIGFDGSILGESTLHSGTGRYALQLLRHLGEIDTANEYVLYAPNGCAPPPSLPGRFRWSELPLISLGRATMLATYLLALPRRVRADGIEVFHAPTVHARPGLPPLPRRLPCPLVVTVHDLIPLTHYASGPAKMPWRHRRYFRWNLGAAERAARILTVSEASKAEIVSLLDVQEERVVAMHNGVDIDSRHARIATPNVPYVLYVGSFEPRKNLTGMLRAYASARRRGLPHALVVVASRGSGPEGEARELMEHARIGGHVSLIERVTDAQLRSLYGNASMFVFPSLAEGFGLPPLEAMAEGTPIVASSIPALREVLGDTALFVQPDDIQGFADAMLLVASDPSLRDSLATAGRARASRFTWDQCARGTLDVYAEAASSVAMHVPASMRRSTATLTHSRKRDI